MRHADRAQQTGVERTCNILVSGMPDILMHSEPMWPEMERWAHLPREIVELQNAEGTANYTATRSSSAPCSTILGLRPPRLSCNVLNVTYSTGMKSRFNVVAASIPPKTVVPTD